MNRLKRILSVAIVMTLLTPSALIWAQDIVVRSDEKLDNKNFNNYNTYYWASQIVQTSDSGYYFLNDLDLKANIREAVKDEMEERGYKLQVDNPDLVVNFRVVDRPTTIRGQEGYGTKYWSNIEYGAPKDESSYEVNAGTIVISLSDMEAGEIVWQGFASGLDNDNGFIKDKEKIRDAVNRIFEQYVYHGSEYSKR